jgi:hypothetical protein
VVAHYRPPVLATGTHFAILFRTSASEAKTSFGGDFSFLLNPLAHLLCIGAQQYVLRQRLPHARTFHFRAGRTQWTILTANKNRGPLGPRFPDRLFLRSKTNCWRERHAEIVVCSIVEVHFVAGFDTNSDRSSKRFNSASGIHRNVGARVAEIIEGVSKRRS